MRSREMPVGYYTSVRNQKCLHPWTIIAGSIDNAGADIGFVEAAVLALVGRLEEPELATLDHRHSGTMRSRHVERAISPVRRVHPARRATAYLFRDDTHLGQSATHAMSVLVSEGI